MRLISSSPRSFLNRCFSYGSFSNVGVDKIVISSCSVLESAFTLASLFIGQNFLSIFRLFFFIFLIPSWNRFTSSTWSVLILPNTGLALSWIRSLQFCAERLTGIRLDDVPEVTLSEEGQRQKLRRVLRACNQVCFVCYVIFCVHCTSLFYHTFSDFILNWFIRLLSIILNYFSI